MSGAIEPSSRKRRRCALAFFGIDRRLDITAPTIARNVLEPAAQLFEVSSVGHFWTPRTVSNVRSGESGVLGQPRLELLPRGDYRVEEPLRLDDEPLYQEICRHGDFYDNNCVSLGNLYSQLTSLQRATDMALALRPDCVVFLRPDLTYHDSLGEALRIVHDAPGDIVALPHWQPHGGCNDRFALCCGENAIRAYGYRLTVAREFCARRGRPLHAEKLLKHALGRVGIPIQRIKARASRVRLDGAVMREDFSLYGWKLTLRLLAAYAYHATVGRAISPRHRG